MFVHEVMTRRPQTVRASTHVSEALRLLDSRGVTSMPVVDARHRVIGVVSEADLVREAVLPDPRAGLLPDTESRPEPPTVVEEVMSRHALTVRGETDVAEAVELMTSTAVKSLPVVDDHGRVVGVVSRRDVVHALARSDDVIEAQVDELFDMLGVDWDVSVDEGRVVVDGPLSPEDRSLATTTVTTVPGVRSVHLADESAGDAADVQTRRRP